MLGAMRLPRSIAAAARKSSMRPLVQEPMNTLSRIMLWIGIPGSKPMYLSARSIPPRLTGSFSADGSGTRSLTSTTMSGDVPHVTSGRKSDASNSIVRANCASGSLTRVRQ